MKMVKRRESTLIPIRFVILMLSVMMAAILYLTRVNLNVAIVAMVYQKIDNSSEISPDGCRADNIIKQNSTSGNSIGKKFNWDQTQQGVILGAFFYGYVSLQVVGGRLAELWGAKWLCASGLLLSGIINMLTPLIAEWNLIALIISRIILGAFQSVDFPACYLLLTKWFPERELGTALGVFTAGSNIGAITTMGVTGYLSSKDFLDGWPSVFYLSGFISCIWFIFWSALIKSEPQDHYFISQLELEYIENNRANKNAKNINKPKPKAPWIKILTSKPVIVLIIIKFAGAWNFLLVMTKVPAYLQSVLHYPIAQNGYMMALIYISLFISMTSGGFITDFIINKKWMRKTLVRKIFETIAIGGSSIALAFIPLAGCEKSAVIAIFMVSMLSYGQVSGGDIPIVPDMTTNFPGTVIAIANSIATISGITAPLIVGVIIKNDDQSRVLWSYVFYLSALINAFALILFLIWGEAEVQDWDYAGDSYENTEQTSSTNCSRESQLNLVSKL